MTDAYLIENPPRIRQFRERGTRPSGVAVVHTAESAPDVTGEDGGAEAVARFIQDRDTYGSYHDLCDSDSIVLLVPYHLQAYGDGTGSNPHAYHVSGATQAHRWLLLPRLRRRAMVKNMARASARYAMWLKDNFGIEIPARRITRAESEARVPGFIPHGDRDPGRRTDPGADFPWDLFLRTYHREMNPIVTFPNVRAALITNAAARAGLRAHRAAASKITSPKYGRAERLIEIDESRRKLRAESKRLRSLLG